MTISEEQTTFAGYPCCRTNHSTPLNFKCLLLTNELLVGNVIFIDWNTLHNILLWNIKYKMYDVIQSSKKNHYFFRNVVLKLTSNYEKKKYFQNIKCRTWTKKEIKIIINSILFVAIIYTDNRIRLYKTILWT